MRRAIIFPSKKVRVRRRIVAAMIPSLKGSSDPFSGTGTLPSEYLTVPDAEKFSRGQKQLERNQGELRTVYPDLNDQSTSYTVRQRTPAQKNEGESASSQRHTKLFKKCN